jgi:hypothetical protein
MIIFTLDRMNEKREYHKEAHNWRVEGAAPTEKREKEGYQEENE